MREDRSNRRRSLALGALGGALIGCAWLVPSTPLCAVLGWCAAITIILCTILGHGAYFPLYLAGLIMHPIGFHWLAQTISSFGGFGWLPTVAIFLLFITLSSVQLLIYAFFYRHLPVMLDRFALRTPIAWTIGELVTVRIFPWQFAHTQIAFVRFVQIADLAGSLIVTFLLFWVSEALIRFFRSGRNIPLLPAPLFFILALLYGDIRINDFLLNPNEHRSVAIVQANVSIEEKHQARMFVANLERYISLSRDLVSEQRLIIWPETVITDWIPASIDDRLHSRYLNALPTGASLMLGALTFEPVRGSEPLVFNSAIGINTAGTINGVYHKQILMPFGEYVPFSAYFPFLKKMAGIDHEFSAGQSVKIFSYDGGIKAAPLICYEDVIPQLARAASSVGANVLVNLANDAWFGDSAAPYQHHMIAAFRAIENRRFLIRSTNSGLTAVVDPLGRTTSLLPPFSEGVLRAEITPIDDHTIFTRYDTQRVWWILLMVCAAWIGYKKFRRILPRSNLEVLK